MNEADFQHAIRLLHVIYAWSIASGLEHCPAREDALYPGKYPDRDRRDRAKLNDEITRLLARHPYSPPNGIGDGK